MKTTKLAALALFVSIGSLGLALALALGASPSYGAAPRAADATVVRLEQRLAALEQSLEQLDRELEYQTASAEPARAVAPAPGEPEGLAARFARLDERLRQLEGRAWSMDDLVERGFRIARLGLSEADLVRLTKTALDQSAAERDRLEALRMLRGQFRADATDARLPVLEAVLALAQSSEDPAVRAGVLRQLADLKEPRALDPLLASMASDADPDVRIAAAEGLGAFRSEASVRDALALAIESDADEWVKDAAFEALHAQPRRAEEERMRGR